METINISPAGVSCTVDDAHCITCSDEAMRAKVLGIDELLSMAEVDINGQTTEIDISLVDDVKIGQILLVHGGVALERLDGGQP